MNINKFFDDLNSKSWKKNINSEASLLLDTLLDEIYDFKEEIIENTLNDIRILQEMKLEEKEELTYEVFKEWLSTRLKENIIDRVNKE